MTGKENAKELEATPTVPTIDIKAIILTIREKQVLLDSDVAHLYGYEVKRINETAARNFKRFPEHFRFQLTQAEVEEVLRSQFATLKPGQGEHRKYRPYAYTEQGIGMLSGLLKNETAIQVSIGIMDAFVEMRKFLNANRDVFAKIVNIDNKLMEHDKKFDEVFDLLHQPEAFKQSLFFKGQFYDAFLLVIGFIEKARSTIIIIDNYADNSVLEMLGHKKAKVHVTIITSNPDRISRQHLSKFTAQHGAIKLIASRDFHDRFVILDNNEVYVFGGSLKDLGNKSFGVFKSEDCKELLKRVSGIVQSESSYGL